MRISRLFFTVLFALSFLNLGIKSYAASTPETIAEHVISITAKLAEIPASSAPLQMLFKYMETDFITDYEQEIKSKDKEEFYNVLCLAIERCCKEIAEKIIKNQYADNEKQEDKIVLEEFNDDYSLFTENLITVVYNFVMFDPDSYNPGNRNEKYLEGLKRSMIRRDPPFFKLSIGNQTIYVLGSFHADRIKWCLPFFAYHEFNKIMSEKPTLYLEHSSDTAQTVLESQGIIEGKTSSESPLSMEIGLEPFNISTALKVYNYTPAETTVESAREGEEPLIALGNIYEQFKNDKLHISPGIFHPNLTIDTALKFPIEIALPLISTHYMVLNTQTYGGFENDLVTSLRANFVTINSLEDIKEALSIVKDAADPLAQNKELLKTLMSISEIRAASAKDQKLHIKSTISKARAIYKRHVGRALERRETQYTPDQAMIRRNELWVRKILKDLTTPPSSSAPAKAAIITTHESKTSLSEELKSQLPPLLIVVGDDHLKGSSDQNFILLLSKAIKSPLSALNYKGEWEILSIE